MTVKRETGTIVTKAQDNNKAGCYMKDLFRLDGEIVLITGGTGVIGTAFGEAVVNAGATVVLWSRGKSTSPEEALKNLEEKTGKRGKIFSFTVDTSDKNAVEKGFSLVVEKVGVPTVLVNGVGGNKGKSSFIDADVDLFEDILKMNLVGGVVIPTQVVTKYWIDHKIEGSIINLASSASFVPLSGVWAYDAAKAAVLNLTAATAKEFAPYNIRVNGIAPGFYAGIQNRALLYKDYEKKILTDRGKAIIDHTPFGRFGNPEELHGAVVFLASRKASGFVTGITISVDGGYLIDNI